MWLWYKLHEFAVHIRFKHIYLYIQKPHIEHTYLPHANAFGNNTLQYIVNWRKMVCACMDIMHS